MAARLRKFHQDDVRAKIQTSQLINRLTDHALSDEDILSTSQVNAIKILLGKTLPDLQSVEGGGDNGEFQHEVNGRIDWSSAPDAVVKWAAEQHARISE